MEQFPCTKWCLFSSVHFWHLCQKSRSCRCVDLHWNFLFYLLIWFLLSRQDHADFGTIALQYSLTPGGDSNIALFVQSGFVSWGSFMLLSDHSIRLYIPVKNIVGIMGRAVLNLQIAFSNATHFPVLILSSMNLSAFHFFFDLFLQCFEWSPKGSFISLTRFIPRVLFLKYCKWDFSYLWFLGFVHKEGSLMAWSALKGLIISHWTFSQHLTREATLQDPRFVSFSYANYNYAILIFPKTPNRLKSPQCNLP